MPLFGGRPGGILAEAGILQGPTVRRADSLACWNTVVTEAFSTTNIRSDTATFQGALGHCSLEGAELFRIQAQRSLAEIAPHEGEHAHTGRILLHLQSRGTSVTGQSNHRGRLDAGQALLCNPNSDYSVEFEQDYEMYVLRLPVAPLTAQLSGIDLTRATAQPLDSHFSKLLLAFIEAAWQQSSVLADDPEWRDCIGRTAADLLVRAIHRSKVPAAPEPGQALRNAILTHIREHLADSELRTSAMANALGVSNRTVQSVFERMGTTASAYVLKERLTLAAARLCRGPVSITELAFDVGFNDPAYFSRCFHHHYGQSPRDFARR